MLTQKARTPKRARAVIFQIVFLAFMNSELKHHYLQHSEFGQQSADSLQQEAALLSAHTFKLGTAAATTTNSPATANTIFFFI